ncbi:MAG: hypothetical protein IJA89_07950 [Clostridia bacterium]|nr:hypothetical protein [Clostridia bacterium]
MKNKAKRILATAMCGILTVSSTVFLGSTVEVDEDLERAKELAKSIFMQVEEEKEQPYYYADYMKGLDGEEDYIIVGRHNASGYAVFERSEMELVEYSETGEMPIKNTNASYYAGPANYYVEENEEYKHIGSGEKIDKQRGKEKAKKVKEKIKKIKKDRKEKKEKEKEEKQKEQQEQVEQAQVSGMSYNPLGSSSVQPLSNILPNGTVTDADEYPVTQRKYISNYEYFKYLTKDGYGNNTTNTCPTVATQILLSYNNWANDGRLIEQEEFHLAKWAEKESEPYHEDRVGTSNEFYETLLDYLQVAPDWFGTLLSVLPGRIDDYLEDYTDIADTVSIEYDNDNPMTTLKAEIDENRPALAYIRYYDTDQDEPMYHIIVAYGYQTFLIDGEEVDGIVGHFGWYGYPSDLWANEEWLRAAMTFQTSHVHNDQTLNGNSHILFCEDCERTKPTDTHTYRLEEHKNKDNNNGDGETSDKYIHDAICTCGHSEERPHNYTIYTNKDFTHHYSECACGYIREDYHSYKTGDTCYFCGREDWGEF